MRPVGGGGPLRTWLRRFPGDKAGVRVMPPDGKVCRLVSGPPNRPGVGEVWDGNVAARLAREIWATGSVPPNFRLERI